MSTVSYGANVSTSCQLRRMSGLWKRIREAREAAGVTQEALGRACGVSRAAVAQWEAEDGTAPTLDKIEPMTNLLDVDPVYLLRGQHAKSRDKTTLSLGTTVQVPEYDVRVSAGGGFHIAEETKKDVWLFSRRYVSEELRLSSPRLVVFEVIGDSMEPTLRSGDRVLVNMSDTRVSQPGLFVLWDGDGTVVKRLELVPGTKPQMIKRISDNPLHGTYEIRGVEVKIVGRVVWFARRM